MKARIMLCGLLVGCLALPAGAAPDKKDVSAGTPVTIIVKPAEAAAPAIPIKPNGRSAKAVPLRCGCGKTGGGNIDVAQPTPDALIITVTGAALASAMPCLTSRASIHVDLTQCFLVSFEKTELKNPKMTVEGRVIGLLRTPCKGGSASESAQAAVGPAHGGPALTLMLPANRACDGENLSINDHEGPICGPLVCGKYVLHAQFEVGAVRPCGLCKPSSAEFAPDPALDPLWLNPKEPFHGAAKKDFGFQIIIKIQAPPTATAKKTKRRTKKRMTTRWSINDPESSATKQTSGADDSGSLRHFLCLNRIKSCPGTEQSLLPQTAAFLGVSPQGT